MAVDVNDEIVQDFLVEAGEILEQLGGQLVDLERQPEDRNLLNGIFRGFHTIKGGAGFLALRNLVEVSHKAEDVFDLLRQGERRVDAVLMDVMLRVLDVVNEMFEEIRGGMEPAPAPEDLIAALVAIRSGEEPARPVPAPCAAPSAAPAPPAEAAVESPAADFVRAVAADPAGAASVGGEDITEAEFEALLDQLSGQGGRAPEATIASLLPAGDAANDRGDIDPDAAKVTDNPAAAAPEITEEEFEALLDRLQSERKEGAATGPVAGGAGAAPVAARAVETPTPAVSSPVAPAPAEAGLLPARRARGEAGETEEAHAARPGTTDSTVRVETAVLDQIMNMVGELVLIRNRLSTLEAGIGNEEMTKTVQALDVVTSDLQMAAMKTRMQPIKKLFGRFPRVVRDVVRSLRKEVELVLEGEETDLDKNLVEALADPLVHLVRNAVDHGIELPEVRVACGKPARGTLCLRAEQAGDHIQLTIQDDGAGMDPEVLRRKAVEKGLMDEDMASRLSPQECFSLIFHAGFSTKTEVSDISGRGVGMDVVKTRIAQLNGQIEVLSEKGRGTTILIKLPLTLAIMPVLMVMLGRQIFALPLVNVNEIIDYDTERASRVDGREVMVIRGKALPLFYLSRWLVRAHDSSPAASAHVVVVTVGTQRYGLLVDQLIGQEEVVIKPLGALLQGTRGLSGATITGDGRIALILDLPGLVMRYGRRA
jgi:two-component system chemotaxis sensor kinase CheA